jgi:DNA-directed RNA polymerase specialized sigma24 family protein
VAFQDEELERVEALAGRDGWLLELLNDLPPSQAAAIRARVLEERDYEEIAAALRTSELVIRKRVSRGLATLRREIEETQS